MDPPAYDGSADTSSAHGSELPAYTRQPTPPIAASVTEPKQFTYGIKNRTGGAPWASLIVDGDSRLSKAEPTIIQGLKFAGSVKLILQIPETTQAVCILLRGEIKQKRVAPPIIFFESKHTVWSAGEDAPEGTKKFAALKGDYLWPFSISVPSASTSKGGEIFRLPHTFSDTGSSFNIRYVAELRILRGKLRPDDKVTCAFGYFSMHQPGPPSALRQIDPDGWHTLEPITVKGTPFSVRTVEVKLSLANPLSYTRSASIPCALTIETPDLEALDLVSSPATPVVLLERAVREAKNTGNNAVEACTQGIFWASPAGAGAPEAAYRRRLMGFKVLENAPLARQPVEITTRYGPGPRQRTYSPPNYDARNMVVDQYYSSVVIENHRSRDGWA
ncbi:hypothetical protein DFH08DRAFT_960651 [Mycena albidolilacea]|uniref:Arrestin-like N-terminal domain-containing protein n=1 Tax=Mycena albidolilacea TaxID=1033008 RepID=A0AAD7EQW4_9AGAR|nr:hypothetical protein DFH08DRAFT_960651 [Mycena albidolilacea]